MSIGANFWPSSPIVSISVKPGKLSETAEGTNVVASLHRGASVSEDLEVASGEQDSRLDAHFVCAREAAESHEAPLFE